MVTYKEYLKDKNGDTLLPNISWKNIIYKSEIYPIGSIYLSINSTNPGTLFGGKWEQIAILVYKETTLKLKNMVFYIPNLDIAKAIFWFSRLGCGSHLCSSWAICIAI